MSGFRHLLSSLFGRSNKVDPEVYSELGPPTSIPQHPLRATLRPEGVYRNGDRIGPNYEVQDVLGQGGFGIVYLVRLLSSDRYGIFALKTFRDKYLEDPQVQQRFRREVRSW